ncbi:TPA: winged helix-turn-helix domain-containing protein, partial [Escherichia coli]|nr:winged helix-turn-helix domain-containing protein [Escherichia coli]
EFTDKTLSRKPGAVQNSRRVLICEQLLDLIHGETTEVFDRTIYVLIMRLCRKIEINPHWCFASPIQRLASFWSNLS